MRSGFTLLEVLLAIGLIVMLFAGIFIFYNHSIVARADAQRAAQESQLARAVLGQMTADMRNGSTLPAILRRLATRRGFRVVNSPTGDSTEQPAASSSFVGTATSMSFQTSRCIPLSRFVEVGLGDEEIMAEEPPAVPPVSDLQQVQWWWSYDAESNASSGLFRSRRPAALPPPDEGSAAGGLELDPDAAPESDPSGEAPPAEPIEPAQSPTNSVTIDKDDEAEQDPLLTSECVSPEVQWVHFRYFDGQTWRQEWPPIEAAAGADAAAEAEGTDTESATVAAAPQVQEGDPPIAVEITVGFEPLLSAEQFEAGETVEKRLAELFGVDATEPLPPRTYQVVVFVRLPDSAEPSGGGTVTVQGRP